MKTVNDKHCLCLSLPLAQPLHLIDWYNIAGIFSRMDDGNRYQSVFCLSICKHICMCKLYSTFFVAFLLLLTQWIWLLPIYILYKLWMNGGGSHHPPMAWFYYGVKCKFARKFIGLLLLSLLVLLLPFIKFQ